MKHINKSLDWLHKALMILIGVILTVMLLAMFWQVVSRYVFNKPAIWSESLCLYGYSWVTFLGAGCALRTGQHVTMGIIIDRVNGVPKMVMQLICSILCEVFFVFLIVSGNTMAQIAAGRISATLQVSEGFLFYSLPIGAILLLIFNTEAILNQIAALVKYARQKEDDQGSLQV